VVDGDWRLTVEGDLTMAASTHPFTALLNVGADDHVRGTIRVTQSGWGIKPYRGLMGALRIRDELEILDFDAGRAAQNMMLAACSDGVACCPNGLPDPARSGSSCLWARASGS
jgi:nitroreductase